MNEQDLQTNRKTQRSRIKKVKPPKGVVRSVHYAHKIWDENNPNDKKLTNDGYCIHHKNGKWWNNGISNLQKMTLKEHKSYHSKNRTKETQDKMIAGMKGMQNVLGYKHTKKAKNKISKAMKGKQNGLGAVRSKEFKQNVSNFHKGKKVSEKTRENMRKGWILRKLKKLQNE